MKESDLTDRSLSRTKPSYLPHNITQTNFELQQQYVQTGLRKSLIAITVANAEPNSHATAARKRTLEWDGRTGGKILQDFGAPDPRNRLQKLITSKKLRRNSTGILLAFCGGGRVLCLVSCSGSPRPRQTEGRETQEKSRSSKSSRASSVH